MPRQQPKTEQKKSPEQAASVRPEFEPAFLSTSTEEIDQWIDEIEEKLASDPVFSLDLAESAAFQKKAERDWILAKANRFVLENGEMHLDSSGSVSNVQQQGIGRPLFCDLNSLEKREKIRKAFVEMETDKKKAGSGSSGFVYSAYTCPFPSFAEGGTTTALPQSVDTDDLTLHAAMVGIFGTNALQYWVPNFPFVYGCVVVNKNKEISQKDRRSNNRRRSLSPPLLLDSCSRSLSPPLLLDSYSSCGERSGRGKESSGSVLILVEPPPSDSVPLSEFMCLEGRGTLRYVYSAFMQVVFALKTAKERCGFTHYDLHPQNVRLSRIVEQEKKAEESQEDRKKPTMMMYIPYENGTALVRADWLASIVNCGIAHISTSNSDKRKVSFGSPAHEWVRLGVFRDRSFPVSDVYTLVLHSLDILIGKEAEEEEEEETRVPPPLKKEEAPNETKPRKRGEDNHQKSKAQQQHTKKEKEDKCLVKTERERIVLFLKLVLNYFNRSETAHEILSKQWERSRYHLPSTSRTRGYNLEDLIQYCTVAYEKTCELTHPSIRDRESDAEWQVVSNAHEKILSDSRDIFSRRIAVWGYPNQSNYVSSATGAAAAISPFLEKGGVRFLQHLNPPRNFFAFFDIHVHLLEADPSKEFLKAYSSAFMRGFTSHKSAFQAAVENAVDSCMWYYKKCEEEVSKQMPPAKETAATRISPAKETAPQQETKNIIFRLSLEHMTDHLKVFHYAILKFWSEKMFPTAPVTTESQYAQYCDFFSSNPDGLIPFEVLRPYFRIALWISRVEKYTNSNSH